MNDKAIWSEANRIYYETKTTTEYSKKKNENNFVIGVINEIIKMLIDSLKACNFLV